MTEQLPITDGKLIDEINLKLAALGGPVRPRAGSFSSATRPHVHVGHCEIVSSPPGSASQPEERPANDRRNISYCRRRITGTGGQSFRAEAGCGPFAATCFCAACESLTLAVYVGSGKAGGVFCFFIAQTDCQSGSTGV